MKIVNPDFAKPTSEILDESEAAILELCTSLIVDHDVDYRMIVGMLEDIKSVYMTEEE